MQSRTRIVLFVPRFVPIEKIKVGDEVVSRNSATGKLETEPVTALVPLHPGKLLDIRIAGERDPLRPSTGHPFWVKRGDTPVKWIAAGQMCVGDLMQNIAGDWRRIVAIAPGAPEQTVYNFTVDNDHDYFVGETGFLAHYADCPCNLKFTDRMTKNGFRRLLNDIRNNGLVNNVINFVPIAGENYVLLGNNRLMAAQQLGLTDQLVYAEVQLPFRDFQTEEGAINAAGEFLNGPSCMD